MGRGRGESNEASGNSLSEAVKAQAGVYMHSQRQQRDLLEFIIDVCTFWMPSVLRVLARLPSSSRRRADHGLVTEIRCELHTCVCDFIDGRAERARSHRVNLSRRCSCLRL